MGRLQLEALAQRCAGSIRALHGTAGLVQRWSRLLLPTKGLEEDELPPCVAAQPGFWLCNAKNILRLCAGLCPASSLAPEARVKFKCTKQNPCETS